jgi:hypothetical protein
MIYDYGYGHTSVTLEMLAIKVTATPEQIDLQGIIPLEITSTQMSGDSPSLPTTARTSA